MKITIKKTKESFITKEKKNFKEEWRWKKLCYH